MSAINVNRSNFNSVTESDRVVLLDFYAEWCGPCRMVLPVIDGIAKEYPQYVIGKVNVDSEPELAKQFGVFSIPTLAVIKDGNVIKKVTGARSKAQILELLES